MLQIIRLKNRFLFRKIKRLCQVDEKKIGKIKGLISIYVIFYT